MNPQWHDEFVALCAVFPSGELTEEEWALLQVHLAYCNSCRTLIEQYEQIAASVIPVLAASASQDIDPSPESSAFSIENAEKRLMSQLDLLPGQAEPVRAGKPSRRLPLLAVAASAAIASGLLGIYARHSSGRPNPQPASTAQVAPIPSMPETTESDDLRSRLAKSERETAALQQQLNHASDRAQQLQTAQANFQQQINKDSDDREKIEADRDALRQQLVAAQNETQTLREGAASASTIVAQHTAKTATLEAKLNDASASLQEKDRMLALDKELLAHDRDIRDLIGARNLYIADIYDVAESGKTNKPFGRVFYTKDKSLVFYGYDLDKQSGLKQSVTFQAWGSGDDKQDVSLGLFYEDDTHKRWVLRFSDTKTLAHLNKVFVTAEPQGGSTKPTGKPLLLAYLQVQPNHP